MLRSRKAGLRKSAARVIDRGWQLRSAWDSSPIDRSRLLIESRNVTFPPFHPIVLGQDGDETDDGGENGQHARNQDDGLRRTPGRFQHPLGRPSLNGVAERFIKSRGASETVRSR